MAYFLEYTVPAAANGQEFYIPASETESGYTIPLSETDAEAVHTPELPVRSSMIGVTLADAKEAAQEVIGHSRAGRASLLFEDEINSTAASSGTLVATYIEGAGWTEE